jgi:hypothetical protein
MYDMQETTRSSDLVPWCLGYSDTMFHPDELLPRVDCFCFTRNMNSFDMHTYHIDRLSASLHTPSRHLLRNTVTKLTYARAILKHFTLQSIIR